VLILQGWKDIERGVEVTPAFGNQINITYNGLLSKSGADRVFLHCGYGDPNNWRDVTTMQMDRTARGWEKNVPMKNHTLAFCFKDSANNWDNNNGYNWIARI
jgi:hypothetical protein